ncbi:MAG TPA: hypothetical protein VKV39_13295 [Candidatus Sulfotelmatobacter sp.]|nr:hypothetical protein [Candidatus Sulfotelmatobacter sp.]
MSRHLPSTLHWLKVRLVQVSGMASVVMVLILRFPICSAGAQSTAATPVAELPPGSMQAKATTACTECHEARIILQQRLSKAAWTKEVDKMVKWGAVVDANDHDALVDYFSANFGVDQPQFQPPRTPEKKSSVQSK